MDLDWIIDELALGGSFSSREIDDLIAVHHVAAVVDVRAECCDDAYALKARGIAFMHLPTPDHCAIGPALLARGVAFACARITVGERTLVHGEHGVERSALLVLCILVDRGLTPLEALALAKSRHASLAPSAAQYEAWRQWMRHHPRSDHWELPTFDQFAAIAYDRSH